MTHRSSEKDEDEPIERGESSEDEVGGSAQRASVVEFGLILTLIVVVAVIALVLLDDALADLMSVIGESVE